MRDFTNDRLHTLDKGFEVGEIVIANQDNGWLVSTFKTCEVSADEHEAMVRALVESFNACRDALAVLEHTAGDRSAIADATAILRRAIYGEGVSTMAKNSATPWPPPRRAKVHTNRHGTCDGQAWGWITDRDGRTVGYWTGEAERCEAEAMAARYNAAPNGGED